MVKKDKLIIITKEGLACLIAFIFLVILIIVITFGVLTIKNISEEPFRTFCAEEYNTSRYDYRKIGYSEDKYPLYKIRCGEEVLQRFYTFEIVCNERDSFGYCFGDMKRIIPFSGGYKLIEGYD